MYVILLNRYCTVLVILIINIEISNIEDLQQETVADDLNTVGTEIEVSITGI